MEVPVVRRRIERLGPSSGRDQGTLFARQSAQNCGVSA
jgi:hypothetical protein